MNKLEVGKTYRAKNGAEITVTDYQDDRFLATVTGNTLISDGATGMLYSPRGLCYGIPSLDADWEEQAVKYDISKMKLIFDVEGKPALAEAIAARLAELGGTLRKDTAYGPHTMNVSLGWAGKEGVIDYGPAPGYSGMWRAYRLTTLEDLYDLESWAKPKPTLPDKPSELLCLAVDDLEKTEAMPDKYRVNMGEWHSPADDKCLVCFAGSVMAQTLNAPIDKGLGPADFDDMPKLDALECFRTGNVSAALDHLDIDLGVRMPPCFVTPYKKNPETFKAQMLQIACWLESIGH